MTSWQHIPRADFTSQHAYRLQASARINCIIAVHVIFLFRLLYMLVLSSACKLHKHGCSSAQQPVSQHFCMLFEHLHQYLPSQQAHAATICSRQALVFMNIL